MDIRTATLQDAAAIAEIYNYYVRTSHATFEIEPVDAAEMRDRIEGILEQNYPFFVGEENGEIIGCAFAHQFKARRAYRHSVEVSVYLKNGFEGNGVGSALYQKLFSEISQRDFHAVIAGISLPNDASIRLHEKFGFEKVAHFKEVGFKFGRWIDVGYWQLINRK